MMAPSVPLDAQIIDHQNDTIGSAWFRREAGQTLDTDGQVVTTVAHSSENAPIKSWLHQDASVTWAMASTDTIWSVNMAFVGEDFDPQATTLTLGETGGLANYYLAHTGTGITGVQAYRGIKRVDIYPRVDLQHHYGSAGHKMTFVFRPGADPSAVQLFFSGQDSLGVDVQGMLRVYLGQRFLKLEEAFAYQLGPNDVLIPVAWTPSYDASDGGGLVSFTFGSYDSSKPLVFAIGPPPLAGGGGGGPDNLEWSTMVGTDLPSTVDDHGNALAAADDGSVYLAGSSDDPSYPVAPGALAYQGGLWDAYMMRFRYAPGNPLQDATRDWVTYYGGTDRERFTELRVSNNNSRLYAVGWTTSEDVIKLPNVDPMDATYFQASLSGTTDGVLAAFDPLIGTIQRILFWRQWGGPDRRDRGGRERPDLFGRHHQHEHGRLQRLQRHGEQPAALRPGHGQLPAGRQRGWYGLLSRGPHQWVRHAMEHLLRQSGGRRGLRSGVPVPTHRALQHRRGPCAGGPHLRHDAPARTTGPLSAGGHRLGERLSGQLPAGPLPG
ncbi:MAG: hypothetical protein IPM68_17570 [Flavobacteriales bacterium]|nr:hypothetical protein [Flavobacteriales bacterium]